MERPAPMPEIRVRPPDPKPHATSLAVLARRVAAELEANGVNWRPIAAAHGLTLDSATAEGARIPTSRERAFMSEASSALQDPLLAWRLGDLSIKNFGLIGYATLNAPTVGEALDVLVSLFPDVSETVTLHKVVDGDTVSLVCTNADDRPNSLFGVHFGLNLMRDLIGPSYTPTRVGIANTEGCDLRMVAPLVPAPLTAELPLSFVAFPARHLGSKVAGGEERLAAMLRPYWQRAASELAVRTNVIRSRIEGAVMRNLHLGTPTQERIAGALGLSRRALARDLAAVGGWRALVDDVRRKLARQMLHGSALSTAQVATCLGYSEPTALFRAMRLWPSTSATAAADA